MEIKIRSAQRADLPAILVMFQQLLDHHRTFAEASDDFPKKIAFFQENLREIIRKTIDDENDSIILVVEINKSIAAFLAARIEKSPLYFPTRAKKIGVILDIFVQKNFQGMGVGKKLLDEIIVWFKKLDVDLIEVELDSRNKKAEEFYQKSGFWEARKKMRRKT